MSPLMDSTILLFAKPSKLSKVIGEQCFYGEKSSYQFQSVFVEPSHLRLL